MTAPHAPYGYTDQRDRLLKRVSRLEGQVRGVGRMIEDDRYCVDIVNQLSAIGAAARQLSLQILEGHVRHCVMDAAQTEDAEPKLQELMETLSRAMSQKP
jgi:DNA-binding FrmR family transcriptional regulator